VLELMAGNYRLSVRQIQCLLQEQWEQGFSSGAIRLTNDDLYDELSSVAKLERKPLAEGVQHQLIRASARIRRRCMCRPNSAAICRGLQRAVIDRQSRQRVRRLTV